MAVILIALTLAFSVSIRSLAVLVRKILVGVSHDLYHFIHWPVRRAFSPIYVLYKSSHIPGLLEWISNRYLRQKEQVYGKDHNIWNEYAQPLHKSPREMASQDDREASWRRRSFLHKMKEVKGEKYGDLERGRGLKKELFLVICYAIPPEEGGRSEFYVVKVAEAPNE